MERTGYFERAIPFGDVTMENIYLTSSWAPRREEIQRFVEITKVVNTFRPCGQGKPRILDIGCGTGFFAYLLAITGEVQVVGLDPDEALLRGSPYKHLDLRLEVGDSEDAVRRYNNQNIDLVVNSWMPNGIDQTPHTRRIFGKAIAYVLELGGATGVERQSYEPGRNYRRVFKWVGPSNVEVRNIADRLGSGDLSSKFHPKNYNLIEVQVRKDLPNPIIPEIVIPDSSKYRWEKDLEMFNGPLDAMRISKK